MTETHSLFCHVRYFVKKDIIHQVLTSQWGSVLAWILNVLYKAWPLAGRSKRYRSQVTNFTSPLNPQLKGNEEVGPSLRKQFTGQAAFEGFTVFMTPSFSLTPY